MKGKNRNGASTRLAAALALGAAWPMATAFALDRSGGPAGANFTAANEGPHMSIGAGIRVGVIESRDGVDITATTLDDDGRLIKNLNFNGLSPTIGAEPPGVGAAVNSHATLVSDVIASDDMGFRGVAPDSRIYAAATGDNNSIIAAVEYYNRQEQVGVFNLSLGGAARIIADTENHTGVQSTLNAAGSTAAIAAAPFDFTGQMIPLSLDRLFIRLFVEDGDSGAGLIPPGGGPPPPDDFDYNNLELQLDTVNLPFKLNGLRDSAAGSVFGRTFSFEMTEQQSEDVRTALVADNQLVARIRRVADLADTDSGDNSGNRLEPANAAGGNGNALLAFGAFNDNGSSQLSLALDRLATDRDLLIVKSAGNSGERTAQITDPGDFMNGITVGASDDAFVARAHFSSYRLAGDSATVTDTGDKPEILAPGSNIESSSDLASGTSFAAPHVSGVAALVSAGTEQTPGLPLGTSIDNHLAVKAIILNAARKRFINPPESAQRVSEDFPGTAGEFSDRNYLRADGTLNTDIGFVPRGPEWTPSEWEVTADGGRLLFTTRRPLDDEQGTGMLDAERALIQMDGGEQDPGAVDAIGWDRGVLGIAREASYAIDEILTEGTFLTATLVWDREVGVTEADGSPSDNMFEADDVYTAGVTPDFDLLLYLQGELLARSFAGNGTVEHLHFPLPETGEVMDYELRVSLALGTGAAYGLAWWTVPEPSSMILMVIGCGVLSGRRRSDR